jgi:hypothetical protein
MHEYNPTSITHHPTMELNKATKLSIYNLSPQLVLKEDRIITFT